MEQSQLAVNAAALAAQTILECSGEIYRAEETAIRMCEAFGLPNAEIICFPTGFTMHVLTRSGQSLTRIKRVRDRSIQLQALDTVNSISRASCEGLLTPAQALEALQILRDTPKTPSIYTILAFASSAGFFSVMFGGGFLEFILAFIAGGFSQALIPLFIKLHAPSLLISMAAGFIAAITTLGLIKLFGGGQEAIIAGAIMPLLPGLAMTNAIRDTMRGDLIAGMARTTDALLSAVLIAAGVTVALML
jgi:uncharacterized membrane protein YjjP (DUF1212 family)